MVDGAGGAAARAVPMTELEPGERDRRPTRGSAVPLARSEDISRRRRIYTIQMAVRMVCFLTLPFLPGWWKAIALVGALVLPYVAVLKANDPALDGQGEDGIDAPPVGPSRQVEARPDTSTGPTVIRIDPDGTIHDIGPADDTDRSSGRGGEGPGTDRDATSQRHPPEPATHEDADGGPA